MRATAGRYRLEIVGVDLIAKTQPVELVAGETCTVRAEVAIGRTRSLRCNADGRDRPAPDIALHATVRDAAGPVVVQRDVQSQWNIRGFRQWSVDGVFPFGRYVVEAHTETGLRYRGTFDVRAELDDPSDVDVPWVAR